MTRVSDPVAAGNELVRRIRSGRPDLWAELQALIPQISNEANKGVPAAQALLGGICLEFLDDRSAALDLLEASARVQDPAGMRGLGHMYANGLGVERDLDRAGMLFQAAADAGDPSAKFNLASMLDESSNSERKWRLIEEAAEGGVGPAAFLLAERARDMGDDDAARYHYASAAEMGFLKAILLMSSWCRDGVGGPVDNVQALRWHLKLLDFGKNEYAQDAVALAGKMSRDEIVSAARLADRPDDAETLISAARASR